MGEVRATVLEEREDDQMDLKIGVRDWTARWGSSNENRFLSDEILTSFL